MRRALVALVVAACEAPSPSLELTLSEGPAQECPSTRCRDIPMACTMYLSVRILDPDARTAPLYSDCIEVPRRDAGDLCSVGGVEISPGPLPYRDLEVQVALYRDTQVTIDTSTGVPIAQCPSQLAFDNANGFPVSSADAEPALGGRSFYRAGDEAIAVTLGCTDLSQLTADECEGIANTTVRASVDDFDSHVSVGAQEANRLSVSAGEPQTNGPTSYILNPNDVTALDRVSTSPPAWARDVPRLFQRSVCLTVLDDTPQSTTTVVCKGDGVSVAQDTYALVGVRLTKASLDQILAALALAQFPADGMTIGVVVDGGVPVGGQVVTASDGSTIEYLNSARTGVGGAATSTGTMGAVFVARDAPYGTTFETVRAIPPATARAYGGRIAGKVTVVVLDLSSGTAPQ